jgi:tetratricopeptide (TPR) repeat protein
MFKIKIHFDAKVLLLLYIIFSFNACSIFSTGEGEAKRIRRVGNREIAMILDTWDKGLLVYDNPLVGFKLLVQPKHSDSYEVKTQGLISPLHIPQLQPGTYIMVAIDPEDKLKVALDLYDNENWYGPAKTMLKLLKVNFPIHVQYMNKINSGLELYNARSFESAINIFNEAIKVNSDRIEAYLRRGNSYFMLKKYDEAILDYEIVLQRDPENVTAMSNRGSSYYFIGCSIGCDMNDDLKARPYYEKALIDFDKALSLKPNEDKLMVDTIFIRGACIRKLGNTEEACKEWERAIKAGYQGSISAYSEFCK